MSGSLIIQQPGNSVVTDLGRFRGPRFVAERTERAAPQGPVHASDFDGCGGEGAVENTVKQDLGSAVEGFRHQHAGAARATGPAPWHR